MSSNFASLNLSTIGRMSEDDARAFFESAQWPSGPVCPHCGVVDDAVRMESAETSEHKLRAGVWNCRACDKQFSVTVGTIMESSHIPLAKWLLAFYLFASSKKSLSALQLQRQLGLGSYRSAWHMAHRIRHAMANGGPLPPLKGDVEADEVYIAGKPRHRISLKGETFGENRLGKAIKARKAKEVPVAVLVSRDGQARARALSKVTAKELDSFIAANVDETKSRLLSDEFPKYRKIGKRFAGGHETVCHKAKEYARGDVHSNTAESFNSLFKRSYHGAWHHISREHIQRYLGEQCFRWSNRDERDGARMVRAIKQSDGVRLMYRQPRAAAGHIEGLVAG